MMEFCGKCDNMIYVSLENSGEGYCLKKLCRNCNCTTPSLHCSEPIISTELRDDFVNFKQHSHVDIKHDPAMPRLTSIACPQGCSPNDVMYIKFDQINMKYMYFCCTCSLFWKEDNKQAFGP